MLFPVLHGSFDRITLASWYPDPVVILGVLAAGFLYLSSIGRWRARFPGSAPVARGRVASFFSALAIVVLALLSPLEPLADDYLLTAHMIQHLLLTLAVPPLVLYGLPTWLYDAFRQTGMPWRSWRVLTQPAVAFVLFYLPFSLSHVPWFYNLTLRSTPVHVAEHLLFIAAAFLVWWPLLAPGREYGQLSPGLQMVYLFVATIPGQIVGALVTLASEPLYSEYAGASRVWGLSPLTDQQIGGLLMWVGTGTAYVLALGMVFFRWSSQEDAAERRRYAASRAAAKPAPGGSGTAA
jgi:putative membrane protein